ncbi:MAG: toll/interleukin-1 receptor domain-containing protein [Nitrospira sp.]
MIRRRARRKPAEVFLSHSAKDLSFASRLARSISSAGVPVFFSKKSIRGAQQWHDEIGKALKRCNWFLLVLSAHSVKSKWVKHELLYALKENRFREKIVPCLYKECKPDNLSWTLSQFQFIDFRSGFDGGAHELLALWGLKYRPTKHARKK